MLCAHVGLNDLLASRTSPETGEQVLDLSGSRLTALDLPVLTAWLQQHSRARACVQNTNIGFYETCRHLMKEYGNLELIHSERLAFSADESGRKLESLHARAFLEGRELGLSEALAQVKTSLQATAESLQRVQELHEHEAKRRAAEQEARRLKAEEEDKRRAAEQEARDKRSAVLDQKIDKMQKGCRDLRGFFDSICDAQEVVVTSIVRLKLKEGGNEVFELERGQHMLPKFPPVYKRGVEWDGVLFVPTLKHLYLVEAKSNLQNKDVTGMADRIQRTLEFMRLCASGQLPLSGAKYHDKRLCSSWTDLADAEQVFGVVGAPGFTTEMLRSADEGGLVAVFFNSGTYHLQPPQSGTLLCHKTGEHVAALACAEMTEEDLEEAMVTEIDDAF